MTVIISSAPDWLEDSYWLQQYPWLADVANEAFFGARARFTIIQDAHVAARAKGIITQSEVTGSQVQYKLTKIKQTGARTQFVLTKTDATGSQAIKVITKSFEVGARAKFVLTKTDETGAQVKYFITDTLEVGAQTIATITKDYDLAARLKAIISKAREIGAQSTLVITDSVPTGAQILSKITKDYYLGAQTQGVITKEQFLAGQVQSLITKDEAIGLQSVFEITTDYYLGARAKAVITKERRLAAQAKSVKQLPIASQARFVLYNVKRLRILRDFPSRGTTGLNWSATSTQTGDFSVNNLNTDIVEQIWRTATGVKSATITCDTQIPQGVFVDTVGILNHNLTLGATVTLQASDSALFSTVDFEQSITVERENSYWLSPELPVERYRYWRFILVDTANPANFLSIGTIVFGSSIIFSLDECFNDTLQFKLTQYSDTVQTEGFTNVKNDRGRKRSFTLDFQSLNYNRPNFTKLRNLFETAGTILKCLWIPTPDRPSRFATFGKLVEIPQEEHRVFGSDDDYISLTLSVDESQ